MPGDGLTVLRERHDKLEGRVTTLESTVKREATLRAAMDSDLSKLKAHERSMQALHDVQADHTKRLTRIEGRLVNVEGRLDGVEGRLGNVEDRLGNVEGRLENVETELGTVKIGVHAILDLLNTHLVREQE